MSDLPTDHPAAGEPAFPPPCASHRERPARVVAVVAVLLLVQTPLLWKFFVDLWSRPQYAFFPLLLAAVPFVALVCLRDLPVHSLRPGRAGVVLLIWAAAWLCLATAGVLYLRWLAPVAAWLTLAGGVWAIGGARLARTLWPPAVLLLLLLPPPGRLDEALLVSLRQLAVACAGRLLDGIGVPQFTHGAVIDIPGDRLMVEEACSGINSMLAVLAFTVLLAFWKRLPSVSLIWLLPTAAVYVFWANVGRIVVCAVAKQRYGINLLVGTPHELLGVGLFVACMGLVFSTERLGQLLWRWEDRPDLPGSVVAPSSRVDARSADLRRWTVVAVLFIFTGAAVAWRTAGAWRESTLPPSAAFALPQTLGGWRRAEDQDRAPERAEITGRQSQLAQFRNGPLLATVGIDYPFYGFHDATTCYALAGWTIDGRADRPPVGDGPARFDVALRRPPLSLGTLHFALCDESGRWWRRPVEGNASGVALKLKLSRDRATAFPLAQIQVLRVGYEPLDAAAAAEVERLFDAAATAFAQQVRTWHAGRSR